MRLPPPQSGREEEWVTSNLPGLWSGSPRRSERFVGTQAAADAALAAFDVTGYAKRRNDVWPPEKRGASGLSPWIRHGLLSLPRVHESVHGPFDDQRKFRDELRWQEYARHLYARLGSGMATSLRRQPMSENTSRDVTWDRSMRCIESSLDELERDGWLVNQTRMWLASHWSIRLGGRWRDGEEMFFTHLLDGSRAANRLGWQWTSGSGSSRSYGFSRSQVRKRAPELCGTCVHRDACPIEDWPDEPVFLDVQVDPRLRHDDDLSATVGPSRVESTGEPSVVWLTAESLGDDDPALVANRDLPIVFVFDEPLLRRLQLSGKRLVFLAERLAELATQRELEVHLGDPVDVLAGRGVAATFTPVPGWRVRATRLDMVEVHPWPWLERPHSGSVASFSAWTRALRNGEKIDRRTRRGGSK